MRLHFPAWLITACVLILFFGCSAAQTKPNDADVHYMLGVSSLSDQNPTAALRELLKAAQLAPERADIQQALAQAFYRKGAYRDAEKHYLRALDITPGDPQIENNLAALYLDMHRWDEAIRYFRQAANNLLFATPEIALTGAGFAQFQKGEYRDAVSTYQKALHANPRYAQAYLRLGQTYAAMGEPKRALAQYEKALRLAPQYVPALYYRGLAYMKLHRSDAARDDFTAVQSLAPDGEYARQAEDHLQRLR